LDLRAIKATMGLGQWEVKSADLAQFYAALMAYHLVRGLMGLAARVCGGAASELSFATARTILFGALGWLGRGWVSRRRRGEELEGVCREVGRA